MSRSALQTFSIAFVTVICWTWINTPALRPYSLQFAAVIAVAYVGVKRFSRSPLLHLAPSSSLWIELVLFFAGILLLVGSTGAVQSPFLPLFYILLSIAAFIFELPTLITLGAALPIFLFALISQPPTPHELSTLLSFPFMLPLFILVKLQYAEIQTAQKKIQQAEDQEFTTTVFLTTFLKPKMSYLKELSLFIEENADPLKKQIELLDSELEEFSKNSSGE